MQQPAAGRLVRNWECRFRKKNGDEGTGLLSAELIEIDGKQCAITTTVDITERLHLESQLGQAQKLESVGRLAGGVAHDFNNLLTIINGYSDLILKALPADHPLYSYAQEISKAGDHAAGLTSQLLAFSRKQVIEPRPLDVNTIVNDTVRMLQRLIGEDIELTTTSTLSSGQVMADPDQIHQVIMNLAVNARDAMPDGGRLNITTEQCRRGRERSRRASRCTRRKICGDDRDRQRRRDGREHAPEVPSSRSSPRRSAAREPAWDCPPCTALFARAAGGLTCRSEVGKGSSFKIYMPRIDAAPATSGAGSDREPSAARRRDGAGRRRPGSGQGVD